MNWNNIKIRFLSPVVWGSLATSGLAIAVTLGLLSEDKSITLGKTIAAIIEAVAIMFGALNNPTDHDHF